MERVRAWLRFAGKGEQKVAAVFGVARGDAACGTYRRKCPTFRFGSSSPPATDR